MQDWDLDAIELGVSNVDRSIAFYGELLGLSVHAVTRSSAQLGAKKPFLNLVQATADGHDPARAGLYHTAILYPDRAALGQVMARVDEAGHRWRGGADHLVSEALYLDDPDGNGVELYRDRPASTWRWQDGQVAMANKPIDRSGLAHTAQHSERSFAIAREGITLGHVHLESLDIDADESLFIDSLALSTTMRVPSARFLSWGGYHHHLAINNWADRNLPVAANEGRPGLRALTLKGPKAGQLLTASGLEVDIQAA